MFNHRCINLRGDVAARALSREVAFYGTLTLLLPPARLLQSPCSKPENRDAEKTRGSLPNPFSLFLPLRLSLSLSGSLTHRVANARTRASLT